MITFNEIKMPPEIMAKIDGCKSAEELVKLAADNGVELSLADAKNYFEKIPGMMLSDDDLDKVSGGYFIVY